jgi:hypothetical protein
MDKDKFIKSMKQCGDAYITYISPNSKKEKFNVATLDIDDNDYIKSKGSIQNIDSNKVLVFCWDTDSFRQIDPSTVIKVEPLSAELEKVGKQRHGRRNNVGNNFRR